MKKLVLIAVLGLFLAIQSCEGCSGGTPPPVPDPVDTTVVDTSVVDTGK